MKGCHTDTLFTAHAVERWATRQTLRKSVIDAFNESALVQHPDYVPIPAHPLQHAFFHEPSGGYFVTKAARLSCLTYLNFAGETPSKQPTLGFLATQRDAADAAIRAAKATLATLPEDQRKDAEFQLEVLKGRRKLAARYIADFEVDEARRLKGAAAKLLAAIDNNEEVKPCLDELRSLVTTPA
jgi:hypothetical protein